MDICRLFQQCHLGEIWSYIPGCAMYFIADFFSERYTIKVPPDVDSVGWECIVCNVVAQNIDADGWKIVFGYSAFRYTDNIKANFN